MSVATLGTFTTKRNVRVQKLQGTNCLRIQSKGKERKEKVKGLTVVVFYRECGVGCLFVCVLICIHMTDSFMWYT